MRLPNLHIGNLDVTAPNDQPDFYLVGTEGEDVEVPGLRAEQLEDEVHTVLAGLRRTIEARRSERRE